MTHRVRIVFVDAANTCRSPMAEAIARKMSQGMLDVESAGIYPGQAVTPEAVRVIKDRFGIDISGHRPKGLDNLSLDEFDYIVAMDGWVKRQLQEKFSGLGPKRFVSWEIEDPYGKGYAKYQKCSDEIREAVTKLLKDVASNVRINRAV